MHECISKLLNSCLDDSFECFTSCCPPVKNNWTQRRPRSVQRSAAVFSLRYIRRHLKSLFLKNRVSVHSSICLPPSSATDGPVLQPHKPPHQKGPGLSRGALLQDLVELWPVRIIPLETLKNIRSESRGP